MTGVEIPTELDLSDKLGPGFSAPVLMASKESHIVFLTGGIVATNPSKGDLVVTIPAGWRVKTNQTLAIFSPDGGQWATVDCDAASGKVTWRAGSAGAYAVSGTSFVDPWGNR